MADVCPNCGSADVLVGNFPLSCSACGWSYLNAHPCRVCGAPATGVAGGGGVTLYACPAHPFTDAEIGDTFRGFAAAVLKFHAPTGSPA